MLFTFLTTLILYSTKKIHETYWCSSSIAKFNNCSLIGLFHSQKKTKTKSTDLARVVLQKICHDKQLSFEQLLEKDGSVFVNEKYFHKIGAEIYKVSKVL